MSCHSNGHLHHRPPPGADTGGKGNRKSRGDGSHLNGEIVREGRSGNERRRADGKRRAEGKLPDVRKFGRSCSGRRETGMIRRSAVIVRQRQKHCRQPVVRHGEVRRRHLDLGRSQQAQPVSCGVIVSVVFVPPVRLWMRMNIVVMSVRMRLVLVCMFMFVMDEPGMFEQRVRRCWQPEGDQQQQHDLLHTTH